LYLSLFCLWQQNIELRDFSTQNLQLQQDVYDDRCVRQFARLQLNNTSTSSWNEELIQLEIDRLGQTEEHEDDDDDNEDGEEAESEFSE
jgi:hypothetical protein